LSHEGDTHAGRCVTVWSETVVHLRATLNGRVASGGMRAPFLDGIASLEGLTATLTFRTGDGPGPSRVTRSTAEPIPGDRRLVLQVMPDPARVVPDEPLVVAVVDARGRTLSHGAITGRVGDGIRIDQRVVVPATIVAGFTVEDAGEGGAVPRVGVVGGMSMERGIALRLLAGSRASGQPEPAPTTLELLPPHHWIRFDPVRI